MGAYGRGCIRYTAGQRMLFYNPGASEHVRVRMRGTTHRNQCFIPLMTASVDLARTQQGVDLWPMLTWCRAANCDPCKALEVVAATAAEVQRRATLFLPPPALFPAVSDTAFNRNEQGVTDTAVGGCTATVVVTVTGTAGGEGGCGQQCPQVDQPVDCPARPRSVRTGSVQRSTDLPDSVMGGRRG